MTDTNPLGALADLLAEHANAFCRSDHVCWYDIAALASDLRDLAAPTPEAPPSYCEQAGKCRPEADCSGCKVGSYRAEAPRGEDVVRREAVLAICRGGSTARDLAVMYGAAASERAARAALAALAQPAPPATEPTCDAAFTSDGDRKLTRNAARCRGCGQVIESKAQHDWVQCKCGATFVDGGLAYLRRGYTEAVGFDELSEYEPAPEPDARKGGGRG
jgi:hypothetical protein